MSAIVDVVLPVFGLILSGYLAGLFGVLGAASSEALNRFVYYFALPALLALGTARVPLAHILDGPFIAVMLIGGAGAYLATVLVGRLAFGASIGAASLAGLAATFGNTGYMGIPLFLTAFGQAGTYPAVVVSFLYGLVFAGVTIAILEIGEQGETHPLVVLKDVAAAVAFNPMILAPAAGALYGLTGFPLPSPIATFASLLGAAAGPGALFAIGLFLATRPAGEATGGGGEVLFVVVVKLVLAPLLVWVAAAVIGLDPWSTWSGVVLAALPTAATSFVLASQYETHVQRVSAAILVTTVLSVASLSLWLLWLGPAPR